MLIKIDYTAARGCFRCTRCARHAPKIQILASRGSETRAGADGEERSARGRIVLPRRGTRNEEERGASRDSGDADHGCDGSGVCVKAEGGDVTLPGAGAIRACWAAGVFEHGAFAKRQAAGDSFLRSGLELQRTDMVVDADCSSSGGECDGCTADVDCASDERCERSSGNCIQPLSQ
jgi:hypothetical protein